MTSDRIEQPGQVTKLLGEARDGRPGATDELLPLVYEELRVLARSRMSREAPGHTLQPTALVHEAYARLVGSGDPGWDGKAHFFAAAAEAMRRILIESARRKGRQKHGGELQRTTLTDAAGGDAVVEDLLVLDDALSSLERRDRAMAEVVKLRYFAGLSVEETATALAISPRTVNRTWTRARAWLLREMGTNQRNGSA